MGRHFNRALRLWFTLSLVSLGVDIACYYLAPNSPVPLPGEGGVNYIAIFLVSAPAPFLLAVAIALLGAILAVLRGIWLGLRRIVSPARVPPDYPEPGIGLVSGHKS